MGVTYSYTNGQEIKYEFTSEGFAPFHVDTIDYPCKTYYKIFGDLQADIPPLIVLHGGPGFGHEYCLPFSKLWSSYNIPVVFYDQIGCAASTHLPHTVGDKSFWKVDLFVAELENLLDHLRITHHDKPGFHLFGHSWGGRLAATFAARRPVGLRKLILMGARTDGKIFVEGLWTLSKQLSSEAQKALKEAVEKHDFISPAYEAAGKEFGRMFLCRAADPWPPEDMIMGFRHQAEDSTVRITLQGPSPWVPGDDSWNDSGLIFVLPQINVPTLVINGEYDTAQYESTVPFFEHIPKVRWVTLENASHMSHLDSPKMQRKVLRYVGDFLI